MFILESGIPNPMQNAGFKCPELEGHLGLNQPPAGVALSFASQAPGAFFTSPSPRTTYTGSQCSSTSAAVEQLFQAILEQECDLHGLAHLVPVTGSLFLHRVLCKLICGS